MPETNPETTSILYAPLSLAHAALSRTIALLRPYAPQIVPILVCIFFIPLLLFLSALAGWTVWRSLAVGWDIPIYLQYGDGITPYAQATLPLLNSHQRYDVSVNFKIPATESNLALGNFMSTLTLATPSNKTLASVRRPAIVLPTSSSSFLFFSRSSSIINIDVPMLSSFIAGTTNVIARIEVGRRDGWTTLGSGEGRELSVASSSLRGVVIPHGTIGLAVRFPLTFSIASAGVFLMILSFILASCILPTILQQISKGSEHHEITKHDDYTLPSTTTPEQDNNWGKERLPKKSRRSRSLSNSRKLKMESSETDIFLDQLRRRSSRRFDDHSDSE